MRKTSNPSLISLEEVDILKINDDFEKVFNKYNLFSHGGMGGSGPPTSVQTPLGISANPLKSFFYI